MVVWQVVLFCLAVATYFLLGPEWFVRALGSLCIIHAIEVTWKRRVGVGIRGRVPSFYLGPVASLIYAFAIGAVGLVAVVMPHQFACAIDSSASICSRQP